MSLDLVVEEPQRWHFPWVSERMLKEVEREQSTDILLLGRRTYRSFAAAWPDRSDETPLAAQLNGMKKIVISDQLVGTNASWGPVRVIPHHGDVVSAVRALDGEADGRVSVAGSVSLVERLLAAGLLTELRLVVHPLVLGSGRRLFDEWAGEQVELDLLQSEALGRGARLDVYRSIR